MNRVEQVLDELDPGLSVRLRALKMRLRRDPDWRLIQDLMPRGGVGVDVGANRGVYTSLMSARAGAGGRVHAIEPLPAYGARLRTISRRRGNVSVHVCAVSDQAGSGMLRIPVHHGRRIDSLATLEPGPSGDQPGPGDGYREETCVVPVRTLDELLDGERPVSLLKCDVEGHEQQVLHGAARLLGHDRPRVFIEIEQRHRKDPIGNTFELFADVGYQGWFISKSGLRPLAEFDVDRHQLGFVDRAFVPYEMPAGYIIDFLFCPPGAPPPGVPAG